MEITGVNIALPRHDELQNIDDIARSLKNLYGTVYQITEQLRYALVNLDDGNFSTAYNTAVERRADDAQRTQHENNRMLWEELLRRADVIYSDVTKSMGETAQSLYLSLEGAYVALDNERFREMSMFLQTLLEVFPNGFFVTVSQAIDDLTGLMTQISMHFELGENGLTIRRREDGVEADYRVTVDNTGVYIYHRDVSQPIVTMNKERSVLPIVDTVQLTAQESVATPVLTQGAFRWTYNTHDGSYALWKD